MLLSSSPLLATVSVLTLLPLSSFSVSFSLSPTLLIVKGDFEITSSNDADDVNAVFTSFLPLIVSLPSFAKAGGFTSVIFTGTKSFLFSIGLSSSAGIVSFTSSLPSFPFTLWVNNSSTSPPPTFTSFSLSSASKLAAFSSHCPCVLITRGLLLACSNRALTADSKAMAAVEASAFILLSFMAITLGRSEAARSLAKTSRSLRRKRWKKMALNACVITTSDSEKSVGSISKSILITSQN
mmetsp:Transcript_5535/g.10403  ORF Transcript_5535/g.10403 Transcript_5535/m.10403 type:complete len:239 (+) Transcript_5535:1410-2126(+)